MKNISFDQLDPLEQATVDKATEALQLSYSPYSNFKVGVAILMSNGKIAQGANQENAAYPMCMCGEQVALSHAKMSFPRETMVAMAITTSNQRGDSIAPSPCGSCRQIISEYEHRQGQPIKIFLVGAENIHFVNGINELLPHSFSGKDL